ETPPRAGRRRRTARDRRHLHAQVVLPAFLPGAPDERAAGGLGRMRAEQLDHLRLAHRHVDAVAALHEDVARLDVERQHVDADDELAPETARDHAAAWVDAGVLGREEPVLYLLPDPGVVLGQLGELPFA